MLELALYCYSITDGAVAVVSVRAGAVTATVDAVTAITVAAVVALRSLATAVVFDAVTAITVAAVVAIVVVLLHSRI